MYPHSLKSVRHALDKSQQDFERDLVPLDLDSNCQLLSILIKIVIEFSFQICPEILHRVEVWRIPWKIESGYFIVSQPILNFIRGTGMDKSKCLSRKEEDELGLLRLHILIVCDVLGRYVKESLEYRSYWQRYTSSKMR
jgi:hypothetical protein